MDSFLRHFKWLICLCYFGGIVVFWPSFQDNFEWLDKVFSCLRTACLQLMAKNCHIEKTALKTRRTSRRSQQTRVLTGNEIVFNEIHTSRCQPKEGTRKWKRLLKANKGHLKYYTKSKRKTVKPKHVAQARSHDKNIKTMKSRNFNKRGKGLKTA